MRCDWICLEKFRVFDSRRFEFSPGLNVIVGNNGVGKTTLLEAIGYLGRFRSFRTPRDAEVVRWGCDGFSVVGCVNGSREIRIVWDGARRVYYQGKRVQNVRELYGEFPVIVLLGEDISLVKGSPELRRRELDALFSLIDRLYLKELVSYRRVLKQRNALLRRSAPEEQVRPWDKTFAQLAVSLSLRRRHWFSKLAHLFAEIALKFVRAKP